ncbi:MAG: hypothetical protein LBD48_10790 [Treponema sp.]|jgi:hypothetical protein|nr:hypothetical protein [Treponema sp.]
MKRRAWSTFVKLRDEYRLSVERFRRRLPKLRGLQQKLADTRAGGAYTVETPVVYNTALDDVTSASDIRLILVADNPGRREQAAENRRYLVGPSGKIAGKFFCDNPSLGIDFGKNVIILNKTPVHTPRTMELRELCRRAAGPERNALEKVLEESQREMARLLFEFHKALAPAPVWIIGYSEMKKGGIFETYTVTLRELYSPCFQNRRTGGARTDIASLSGQLLLFRHFSMNQFTIDLKQRAAPQKSIAENLADIGSAYRERILGW